jgi:hypothetical protein
MPSAIVIFDHVAQLADWNQSSFSDGNVATWDSSTGKFIGGTGFVFDSDGTITDTAGIFSAVTITGSITISQVTDLTTTLAAITGDYTGLGSAAFQPSSAFQAAGTYLTPSSSLTPANLAAGTAGISITGNAATVTNGLYSTGSYSDPNWLTAITGSIVSGNITGNAASITGTVPAAQVTGLGTLASLGAAPAGTLTGTTLASNVVSSSLISAAGGSFGTAAFQSSSAFQPAGVFTTANTWSAQQNFTNASLAFGDYLLLNGSSDASRSLPELCSAPGRSDLPGALPGTRELSPDSRS